MAIAVDLHLAICGLILGLALVSVLVHLSLQRGLTLVWLAAALLCVALEMLALRYAAQSRGAIALVAVLVPSAYFCAAQAIRQGTGLRPSGPRMLLACAALTGLSLALLAMPVSATIQYLPFQLAGIVVSLDTVLRLVRVPKRDLLDEGLLALGIIVVAGTILRIPMFPAFLGEPTPWAPLDPAMFGRIFIAAMGLLSAGLALLTLARIVTRVIADYRHNSERDGLTELLNHRAFDVLVERPAMARGAIIMCDIDRFKQINDRFGHHVGDEVIRSFACMLSQHGHHAGRVGGEEFALLLLDTGLDEAAAQAERIRSAFDSLCHPAIGPDAQLSASFGVAAFEPGSCVRAAMRSADRALYTAKHTGRNRVTIACEEDALPQPILSAA